MRVLQASTTLFVFWMVLAGTLEPLDLALGAAVSITLAVWADRFLWEDSSAPALTIRQALRFLAYIPYLIVEIVKAAVYVAEKVLDPRLPISPVIMVVESPLKREISKVALANSITLTPGTLTVDLDQSTFHIHCLAPEFREGIADRILERRVAKVFEEG